MQYRTFPAWRAACLAALIGVLPATASTITHSSLADFQTGSATGSAAVALNGDYTAGLALNMSGSVGLIPAPGAVNAAFSDEFNYTTAAAAQAAGWMFLTPNALDNTSLSTNPPEFLFQNDVSTTGTAAPAAGTLRIVPSRPNEIYDTSNAAQDQPVLAVRGKALTGDFILETRMTFPAPRLAGEARQHGIFIGEPSLVFGDDVAEVNVGPDADFILAGPLHDVSVASTSRFGSGAPTQYTGAGLPGDTFSVRVVKRGAYYYTFLRANEADPWYFHAWFKNAALAAATPDNPVVVGLFEKSWGGVSAIATQYKPTDYEYFRATQLPGEWTGTFTNVMDAGGAADWRTFSLSTFSMEGVKYQLRAGNTLAGNTLSDAGDFAGPDGTANTYFEDDAAQVIPSPYGKRYLEYKLFLDQTPANLPAFVNSVSADAMPAGVAAKYASNAAEYGPDGGGLAAQPGGGDLSVARTQAFADDFNADPLSNGWVFTNRGADYGLIGSVNTTERAGYLRMSVGADQNLWGGGFENGGVTLLRDLPAGVDVNNFEIEAEINVEAQPARNAEIVLWQDTDNWLGVGVTRGQPGHHAVGVVGDGVLNDVGQSAFTNPSTVYGTNTLQIRITKQGPFITFSYRDPTSPSWRILRVMDTTGAATGGADFAPVQVGLFGKSWATADPGPVNYDYNWFRISSLAPNGTKDMTLSLPAGSRLDSILLNAEAGPPAAMKAQVKDAAGAFVGPDGTSATFFNVNEPKIPAALAGEVNPVVRLTMDAAQPSGVPYLHALGAQHLTDGTAIAHDTNAADFIAGTVQANVDTATVPGAVANAGGLQAGTTESEGFSSDVIASGAWAWDNPANTLGNSTYSFAENPGKLRIRINNRENLWTGVNKYYVLARRAERVSGDWEIETHIEMPNGRTAGHQLGIGVFQDNRNLILFGPANSATNAQQLVALKLDNDAASQQFAAGTYADTSYTLRIRKVGTQFQCFVKTEFAEDFTLAYTHTSTRITTPYVGLLAKSFAPATETDYPFDYDYFSFTPLEPNGAFQSRTLDLGAAGLSPWVETLGGNSAAALLQWRAADSEAGLASAAWVGPDGTDATTFAATTTGPLPASLAGKRYYQYRATLPPGASINDIALIGLAGGALPLTRDDAIAALRIAGGLDTATADQAGRLDVVKGDSAGKIEMLDAAAILRQANGL